MNASDTNQAFRDIMDEARISQREAARRIGISVAMVNRIMKSKRNCTWRILHKLASACRIRVEIITSPI